MVQTKDREGNSSLCCTPPSDEDSNADGKHTLSHGWLAKQKGWHGIFSVHLHGETGGTDQQGAAKSPEGTTWHKAEGTTWHPKQRELPGILSRGNYLAS